jgi:hypothetical protein
MSRRGIVMRLLPVIAVAVIVMIVALRPLELSWGAPLLGVQLILSVLAIGAWIPRHPH